jgi:hypothetical protein
MLFKKSITPELAQELFNDSEKALRFIADIKWEEGFVCRKCGNTNYCDGKSPSSRRCTRCKTEESATAHTLFHNCKFPINKAFYIAYTVCVEGKPLSSYCYADQLSLNQMTCWKFRKRIENCLSKHKNKAEESSLQSILMTQD